MILAPTLSLLSSGSGAIVRPTFSRDFAGEKSLNNGTGPAITFTRASTATYFDANGVLQTASNDVPRFDHSGGSSLGLLIEEARTNSVRNSQGGGSTNGVIGSGGVMPTNWTITPNGNNVTSEIIGTGTEDGLSYIDIKVSGTPTGTSYVFVAAEPPDHVVAANGQTWTHSAYAKLQNGAATGALLMIGVSGRLGDGTGVADQITDVAFTPTSAALSAQRISTTVTFSNATVAKVLPYLFVFYTSGQQIGGSAAGITLRIAAPQLEQGAFPTSYIPTTSAAVTRSADSAVVTPISSFYNASEGTLFAEVSRYQTTSNSKFLTLVRGSDVLFNVVLETNATAPTTSQRISVTDSTAQAVIGVAGAVAGTIYKMAGVYKTDDFQFAQDGTLETADTSGTVPTGITRMGVGTLTSDTTNQFFLNGYIRKVAYYPRRLSNALLQSLTT